MGSPAIEPQRVLAGRYRLEQRLGGGGMGAIWRAEHLALQAPVAVKLIDRDAVNDEQAMARFLREAKAAAALRSPHVVHIMDYGMDDGLPFIVMELLDGETLSQWLKRKHRLSAAETARIATHVGRAMTRAHEAGIVHRDLKPENVFIVSNEDDYIAKVLDFGVAKVEHGVLVIEGEKTRTGSILGTPYYMSPEQAQGNKAVDHRSDVWSLGVIVFECLLGHRPFYSDGLGDLVLQICVRDLPVPSEHGEVPLGFDAWFARACCRNVEERFQSAREATDALRDVLTPEMRGAEAPASLSRDPLDPAISSRTTARDAIGSSPVSSRARLEAETLDGRDPSSGRADPIAATLIASAAVNSAALAEREIAAEHSSIVPTSSYLGSVVVVAALALGIGIGGGILMMRRTSPGSIPLTPSGSAAPVASDANDANDPNDAQRKKSKRDHHDAGAEGSWSASSGASAAATTAAAATATREPAPTVTASAPVRSRTEPSSKPLPAATPELDAGTRPDGGWVKPAWAIPDEEIPRHVDGPLDAPPPH